MVNFTGRLLERHRQKIPPRVLQMYLLWQIVRKQPVLLGRGRGLLRSWLERVIHHEVLRMRLPRWGWRSMGRSFEQQLSLTMLQLHCKLYLELIPRLIYLILSPFSPTVLQEEPRRTKLFRQGWPTLLQKSRTLNPKNSSLHFSLGKIWCNS